MKFVTISDTHGYHQYIKLPKGDVLIHAGDLTANGTESQTINFLSWFAKQDYKYKIFIAGNHDFYFEKQPVSKIKDLIPEEIIYLHNSSATIEGIKFWGSPVTPWYYNWAFNLYRGAQIRNHWKLIPDDTDILITHGPIFNILDANVKGEHIGCRDLYHRILEVKPKVHICGHIHEAYGVKEKFGIKFINASMLNEKYLLVNKPIIFEI
ncbi:MAG: metallophosphoesterase [Chitinophagales bacterium]|nr:metallophosphoesterase [Chitinophagales bacterium]